MVTISIKKNSMYASTRHR